MRTLILFALLAFGMNAGAQSLQPTQMAVQPIIIMNADSQALVVSPEGVGIMSNSIISAITRFEGKESAYIGYSAEGEDFKGIYVTDSGKLVMINADKIFIKKPTFQSHAEADAALESGREYWLAGDRNEYHKP
jgi:hypothetical protein